MNTLIIRKLWATGPKLYAKIYFRIIFCGAAGIRAIRRDRSRVSLEAEEPGKMDKTDRPDAADRKNMAHRPDLSDKMGRKAHSVVADRGDRTDRPDPVNKAYRGNCLNLVNRTDMADRRETVEAEKKIHRKNKTHHRKGRMADLGVFQRIYY